MPPTLALSSSSNLTSHHSSANELRFNTITGKVKNKNNERIEYFLKCEFNYCYLFIHFIFLLIE